MIVLTWMAFLFLVLRIMVAMVNALAETVLPNAGAVHDDVAVSVLVPARNEEKNIGNLLESLLEQDYQPFEILVYDDLSEDGTASVVRDFSAKDERIGYIPGRSLPAGWLGKNHACYQLAQHARGQYLLFLDADVQAGTAMIADALAHAKQYNLQLLSLFPRQRMLTPGEFLTVPLMNWILLSLLPLVLTRKSRQPSLAAANGQFMFFEADAYKKYQWHKQLRASRVEDIAIARYMKRQGLSIQTLIPSRQVSCRMYRSYKEGVNGFARNLPDFFGGSVLWLSVFLFFTTGGIFFAAWAGMAYALVYAGLALFLRGGIAAISRQPVWVNVVLAPFQHLSLLWIALNALLFKRQGQLTWKGREI